MVLMIEGEPDNGTYDWGRLTLVFKMNISVRQYIFKINVFINPCQYPSTTYLMNDTLEG